MAARPFQRKRRGNENNPLEMDPSTIPGPRYRVIPEKLNLADEALGAGDALVRRRGNAPALVGDFAPVTYPLLRRRVDAAADGLGGLNLQRGERVLIKMGNSPEFAIVFLAAVKRGIIPVLVNSALTASELTPILEQARPKVIFTEASRSSAVRELRGRELFETIVCTGEAAADEIPFASICGKSTAVPGTADTRSEEPAFIIYTSGTTGKPKGIVHAHRWIVALGDLNRYRLPPREGDVVMATGEWSFISALGHNLLFPLRNGVTGAILPGRATPESVLAAVEKYKVTVLHCVATVYRRILAMPDFEKRYPLKTLRCAHSTGEALREATYEEWKRRTGSELYEHYGVSEYQLVIGNGVRDPIKPGSVGRLLPGVGAAILDDDLKPVAAGELGQFAISTSDPGLFLGYYQDGERTEAVLRDGWYLTGDLAYKDHEGYFFIAGRRDDCFKSRGIFISPTEIENALQKHTAVTEAAVIPVPDIDIGNKIRAVVVLRDGYKPSDECAESIREGLRSQLAAYKIPHEVKFADSLPKSAVGKILRGELTKSS